MQVASVYKSLYWWTKSQTPPYRYFLYSGGRASGKSTSVAQALAVRATSEPILVLCAREFQNSLRESNYALIKQTIEDLNLEGWEILKDELKHENGSRFIFRGLHNNASGIRSIEGVNVCWVEEAQFVSMESLTALDPSIRAENSTLIFTYNPMKHSDPVAKFYIDDATPRRQKQVLHVHTTYKDIWKTLSKTIQQTILAAANTADFAHVWLGEPRDTTLNAIINWSDLTAALEREQEDGAVTFGIDVARYGNDRTVLAIKKGNTLIDLKSWQNKSLTDSARIIQAQAAKHKPVLINIDDTGVGGGLTDILRSQGLPVSAINYARKAKNKIYPNVASELWFDFAANLKAYAISPKINDLAALQYELTSREWEITPSNQRKVQSKSDYKSDGNRSPDLADAVLLAFYQPARLTTWAVGV